MTLDQLQQRDARIAAIEALPAQRRSPREQTELGRLVAARDLHWRRLADQHARTRAKLAAIEAYARQHRLPIEAAV